MTDEKFIEPGKAADMLMQIYRKIDIYGQTKEPFTTEEMVFLFGLSNYFRGGGEERMNMYYINSKEEEAIRNAIYILKNHNVTDGGHDTAAETVKNLEHLLAKIEKQK